MELPPGPRPGGASFLGTLSVASPADERFRIAAIEGLQARRAGADRSRVEWLRHNQPDPYSAPRLMAFVRRRGEEPGWWPSWCPVHPLSVDHSLGRHCEFSVDLPAFKITPVEPDSLDVGAVAPGTDILAVRQRIAPWQESPRRQRRRGSTSVGHLRRPHR